MAVKLCQTVPMNVASDKREMNRATRWILTGWILFIVSAIFFGIAAWRAGDWIAFSGSAAFLLANFAFLAALYYERDKL